MIEDIRIVKRIDIKTHAERNELIIENGINLETVRKKIENLLKQN